LAGAAEPVTLSGKVIVTKRAQHIGPGKALPGWVSWRRVEAAHIKTKNGVVHVVMNPKGRDFGRTMNGQPASIVGTVSEQDGKKWVRVLRYADPRMDAGHELWRRMRCHACAVGPGRANAALPKDLHGTKPVVGRYYPMRDSIGDWCRDGKFLWAVTDNSLIQLDLATGKLVRRYDKSDGLPDRAAYHVASNGKTVWIAYHGGVARLTVGSEKIEDAPELKCRMARVCTAEPGTVVMGDSDMVAAPANSDKWQSYPPMPGADRMKQAVERGIWRPDWRLRMRHSASPLLYVDHPNGECVLVSSFGSLYAFHGARKTWSRIADPAWHVQLAGGKVWFLSGNKLMVRDPKAQKTESYDPPKIAGGRLTQLLVTDRAAWVAAEPRINNKGKQVAPGGLARLDLETKKWSDWTKVGDVPVDRVAAIAERDGVVWAVARLGKLMVRYAHPGMTYVRRRTFWATGFALLRYDAKTNGWGTFPLPQEDLDKRLICGQDGSGGMDTIAAQSIPELSIGNRRIVGRLVLFPRKYFSGYWPSVGVVATRDDDGTWTAKLDHRPAEAGTQGEQPKVLNISNKGEMVLTAVGHDDVLGLFYKDGRHWTITEGVIAYCDDATGKWTKVVESGFRFYWRATAALDDGKALYVGSDRGLVSKLDFKTGRFTVLGALEDRTVSRVETRGGTGRLVDSVDAPLGLLPVQLRDTLKPLDVPVAISDGTNLLSCAIVPKPRTGKADWFFKSMGRRHRWDRSRGNFLHGPGADGQAATPRFYVKEVFFPAFLCASDDGKRLWVATYTGIVRIDVE
jgi:hypothetical protein